MTSPHTYPREATTAELESWDRLTVRAPGGHVYQSRTWADQRRRLGWEPLHVMTGPQHGALVLLRRAPIVGGRSAYIPRGPVTDGEPGPAPAARLVRLGEWLGRHGVDVVATDAEVPAALTEYGRDLRAAGFHAIPEIQPSRHRMSLELARDTDDGAVRAGMTKSTRQRITAAEREGLRVHRYDTAGWPGDHPLFAAPDRPLDVALDGFASLLEATGRRRGFRFGPRGVFLDWWRAAHAAGLLVYLEATAAADPATATGARAGAADGDGPPIAGLILYRHGGRLTTVHSGDADDARERHPGVMHLLRWRAIQLAIHEGCTEMDLGGVDVGPDHAEPGEGHPMAGLAEHKRSFGARWVAMTGAHERIIRPWRHGLGRLTSRLARAAR